VLEADIYNGSAWLSIVIDNLDKLEYHTPLGYINTFTKGWMTKVNLLVANKKTKEKGYMITSIDFENNISGYIRSKGAVLTQKIPSTVCNYNVTKTDRLSVVYDCDEDQTSLSFQDAEMNDDIDVDFTKFVANRFTKFLYQTQKTVQQASELGEGADFPIAGTKHLTNLNLFTNVYWKRLNLFVYDARWQLCQNKTCFIQPYYILVDHKNIDVQSAGTESVI
jgi:hypothetical protein